MKWCVHHVSLCDVCGLLSTTVLTYNYIFILLCCAIKSGDRLVMGFTILPALLFPGMGVYPRPGTMPPLPTRPAPGTPTPGTRGAG